MYVIPLRESSYCVPLHIGALGNVFVIIVD